MAKSMNLEGNKKKQIDETNKKFYNKFGLKKSIQKKAHN